MQGAHFYEFNCLVDPAAPFFEIFFIYRFYGPNSNAKFQIPISILTYIFNFMTQ